MVKTGEARMTFTTARTSEAENAHESTTKGEAKR